MRISAKEIWCTFRAISSSRNYDQINALIAPSTIPSRYHHIQHHYCQLQWKYPILIMATMNEWIPLKLDFLGPRIPLLVLGSLDATKMGPIIYKDRPIYFAFNKNIFALDENILLCNVNSSRSWFFCSGWIYFCFGWKYVIVQRRQQQIMIRSVRMHCFVGSSYQYNQYHINSDGSEHHHFFRCNCRQHHHHPLLLYPSNVNDLPVSDLDHHHHYYRHRHHICLRHQHHHPFLTPVHDPPVSGIQGSPILPSEKFFSLLKLIWNFQLFKIIDDDV